MIKTGTSIIGVMSGTSLDGLDLCLCRFSEEGNKLAYSIERAETIAYPKDMIENLSNCHNFNAQQLLLFNNEYGRYIGNACKNFLGRLGNIKVDAIASHGHTVFHQPEQKFTYQIGSGAEIAAISGINTICDFRTTDVAYGGQGAPLVPVGDKLLFPTYDYCLNIGGFANINNTDTANAYDICPANFILNELSRKIGHPYDKDGNIAKNAKVSIELFDELNRLDYYNLKSPKSLGREWVEKVFKPILDRHTASTESKIASVTEHAAYQIGRSVKGEKKTVLVTGGGALNKFLTERIKSYTSGNIIIPDKETIEYKEALIFGLLGWLYLNNKPNSLSSVTGATKDAIGGSLYKA